VLILCITALVQQNAASVFLFHNAIYILWLLFLSKTVIIISNYCTNVWLTYKCSLHFIM
jgi:hypothetical protein